MARWCDVYQLVRGGAWWCVVVRGGAWRCMLGDLELVRPLPGAVIVNWYE